MKSRSDRLFDKVMPEPNSGCWLWLGGVSDKRYGKFRWSEGVTALAHRASWIVHKGEIPTGLLVCHKCDNGFCVNPDHLFLGTAKDNSDDKLRKGRDTHAFGESHGRSRLNDCHVKAILSGLDDGRTYQSLADEYGVARRTIRDIKTGRNWRHLSHPA
ncbi:HNH endonuclease [Rhizobium lentis]|uniref:HNH nuclease domain-containing protein n=1 Tax=Rhizobium lentis TaxID=1138194 RepID=A0ABS7IH74_9HYPH|nr:hypothetical protein [Rhizobium lentis]